MELSSSKRRALVYADIFDYPLTSSELERWKISNDNFKFQLSNFNFQKTDGYYYLKGRKNLVTLRKKRGEISKLKLGIARKAVNFLKTIPTVKMIAITGALAMGNSDTRDDIDFLIVTQRRTLWLTRALCVLLLDSHGIRRRPNRKAIKDKICLNMFLDDLYLTLPKKEQDLYGAHEVYQVKPLLNKDYTYERFLQANSWARKFLPNGVDTRILRYKGTTKKNQKKSLNILISFSLNILNMFAKHVQLWYMNTRRTREVITEHMMRFHPKDYRLLVIQKFEEKLKKYSYAK